MKIALDCGSDLGIDLTVLQKCYDIYKKVQDNGDGDKDFGIVYQYLVNKKI